MGSEIELISDGTGLAVVGNAADVERFFLSSGLDKVPSRFFDLRRIRSAAKVGGDVTEAGLVATESVGRWVKLTEESAKVLKQSSMMKGPREGTARAIAMGDKVTKHILQIVTKPGKALANPAFIAGVGAVMSQYAMQQQMDEIVEYLELINEKVDDILRGQKDAVWADMVGVDLIVEEALTVREEVGRVSDITWSKVQATSQTLARTQVYALRELDAIAGRLQKKADVGEIAKATREAEPKVRDWLAVLARTFQLQDGVSVLELDRVLDASPAELESHHTGLLNARALASSASVAAPPHSSPRWTRPCPRQIRRCSSTRSTPRQPSRRAIRSQPKCTASAVGSGSSMVTGMRTRSAGVRLLAKCWRRFAWAQPEALVRRSASAIRPSTAPPRPFGPSTSTVTASPTSPAPQQQLNRPERL